MPWARWYAPGPGPEGASRTMGQRSGGPGTCGILSPVPAAEGADPCRPSQPPTSSSVAAPSIPWTTRGRRPRPSRSAAGGSPRSGPDADVARLIGPETRVVELRGRTRPARASRTPTSIHPSPASTSSAATSASPTGVRRSRARSWSRSSGRTRRAPGRPLDPRQRLVHGRLPARHAAPGRPRRRGRRPTGVPARTVTGTAPG